jgi:hypothetical protein
MHFSSFALLVLVYPVIIAATGKISPIAKINNFKFFTNNSID